MTVLDGSISRSAAPQMPSTPEASLHGMGRRLIPDNGAYIAKRAEIDPAGSVILVTQGTGIVCTYPGPDSNQLSTGSYTSYKMQISLMTI